ncbi:MAG: AAA family ATPase [Paracoccaceae bacterium]
MTAAGPSWDDVAAWLAEPGALSAGETAAAHVRPEIVETHTARVFLTPEAAWKLRLPVDYGWLDYGTRARRRAAAEREVTRNAPAAPGLYLGLAGVAGPPFRLLGPGETIPADAEPIVAMARFPASDLFDRMAEEHRLTAKDLTETGRVVATLHKTAPRRGRFDPGALARSEAAALDAQAGALGDAAGRVAGRLRDRAEALSAEARDRPCRLCHGDLHLRNIVRWRGRPAPFDCIDFDDALAEIDPLYDLAFLTMDLRHRRLGALAAPALSSWAAAMAAEPDAEEGTAYGGLGLLRVYEGLRAAIRAKIAALSGEAHAADGRAYLALAEDRLGPRPQGRLIAVGGRSGTGKSTVAMGLASQADGIVLSSDRVRKGLFGTTPESPLGTEGYTPEATRATYAALARRATLALAAPMAVVLDATHLDAADRSSAEAIAAAAGVPFTGVWLDAPAEALRARVAARTGDASDADLAVLERQLARDPGPVTWARVDASADAETVQARAAEAAGL